MNKIAKALGYILYSFGGVLPHYGMGHRWMISQKIRAFCGKLYFDYCGKNVDIGRRAHLSSKMRLGNNSGIGDFCYIRAGTNWRKCYDGSLCGTDCGKS